MPKSTTFQLRNSRSSKAAKRAFRAELLETRVLLSGGQGTFSPNDSGSAPTLPHIVSLVPTSAPALNSAAAQFTLTFDQPVTGVNATEFKVATQGTLSYGGTITVVPQSASVYTVSVNGIHGNGSLSLSFADSTNVRNSAGLALMSEIPITTTVTNFVPAGFNVSAVHDVSGDGWEDLIGIDSTRQPDVVISNGNGSFQPAQAITNLPSGSYIIAVGDVSGDGISDLVASLPNANAVYLVNNGHGTFGSPISLGIQYLYSAAIADFNNDGIPDIVTYSSGDIVTLLGTGGGQFTKRNSSGLDLFDDSALVTDINADGKFDLLSRYGSTPVKLGAGDGTFIAPAQPNLNSYAKIQTFADMNFDGKPDAVVTLDNALGYYAGVGDGTFGVYSLLLSGVSSVFDVKVADVNADGFADLLVGFYNGRPQLYLGTASGFVLPAISAGPADAWDERIAIDDFNGDQRIDWLLETGPYIELNTTTIYNTASISIAQTYPHIVSMTRNTSQPIADQVNYTLTFSEPVTGVSASALSTRTSGSVTAGSLSVTAQSGSAYSVAINSISGSGTIALAFNDNNGVRNAAGNALLSSDTNNGFAASQITGVGSQGVAISSDLNGDGKADIVAYGFANYAALGNGDGTFQAQIRSSVYYSDILIAVDVNNDGKPDLINTGHFDPILLALGNGDGTFSPPSTIDTGRTWDSCDAEDINGDGQVDIVAISGSRHQIATFLGNGVGAFSSPVITSLSSATPTSIAIGDVNGDGTPDALVTVQSVGAFVLAGHRDGTFSPSAAPIIADTGARLALLADVNADQKLDAIVGDSSGSHILLSDGAGTFGANHSVNATFNSTVRVADMNGDGFGDLIAPSFAGLGMIYLSNGDGTFKDAVTRSVLSFTTAAVAADFNGDGRTDLFTADSEFQDDRMFIARNGSMISAPSFVGSVSQSGSINATGPGITLTQDADGSHIDWVSGSQVGQVVINAVAGLTINSAAAMTNIQLDYAGGNPFPHLLGLNGTFTLNGMQGTNPLANTTLNLNASALFITYAGYAANPIARIQGYLRNGFNGGTWTGTATSDTGAIQSTTAASHPIEYSLGYGDAMDPYNPVGLPANTIELRYTVIGDTNLDGTVGGADYAAMVQNYNTGTRWDQGDVTYGTKTGGADYAAVVQHYGHTAASPAAVPATVPASVPVMTPIAARAAATVPGASSSFSTQPVVEVDSDGRHKAKADKGHKKHR